MITALKGFLKFPVRRLSKMIQGSKWISDGNENSTVECSGKAFVRCVDGDDRLRISIKFIRPGNNGVRFFNFERLKDESLASTISRMTTNIQKEMLPKEAKKSKKKIDQSLLPDVTISLYKEERKLDPSNISNKIAWLSADRVQIDKTFYPIAMNFPTVLTLNVLDSPKVNYPVPLKCALEFADIKDCEIEWFVSCKNKTDSSDLLGVLHKNWRRASSGYVFYPKENDLGCHILVKCTPYQMSENGERIAGETVLSQSQNCVTSGPETCPFERRQQSSMMKYENSERKDILRVLSYNVLAECYTDMTDTGERLFPYCPAEFLDFRYRKLLLLKEISGYDADLMFLQEVDKHVFEYDYQPHLSSIGYKGILALKARGVKEGVATFYRSDRFEMLETSVHFVGGVLDSDPDFSALNECLLKVPHIRELFVTRSSVLQTTLLFDKEKNQHLIVGNTHFYFHWTADNIRLLQGYVCAKILEKFKVEMTKKYGAETRILIGGDFNSDYRCGVYRLFTKGKIPGNFNEFYQGGRQNFIPDLGDLIKTDLKLFSTTGTPIYTTFVAAFAACIDYIFAEREKFEVVSNLPIYDEDEFLPYTACPNEFFGSDHFAMLVDLKYS